MCGELILETFFKILMTFSPLEWVLIHYNKQKHQSVRLTPSDSRRRYLLIEKRIAVIMKPNLTDELELVQIKLR